jgi:uncharacterized protein (DUF885 family)
MRQVWTGLVLALAVSACATLAPRDETAADAKFRAIYETEWAWRIALDPAGEDDDPDEDKAPKAWPKVDPRTQDMRAAYMADVLKQLDALDAKNLSPDARMNLAIYRDQIEVRLSRLKFREYEKPLNADTTFWTSVASAAPKAFRNEAQARAWIARLNDVPRYFDDQTANMHAGLARGFTPPRVTLEGRDKSITASFEGKTAETSSFYEPFKALPSSIPAATQAALRADAKAAIDGKVFPAYRKLLPYYRDE